jgi:hypothetical protein
MFLKNLKNIFACSNYLSIKSFVQILSVHKNDKHVDLSTYIFKSIKFIKFCHFYVAHNTKNLVLKSTCF